jgi:hypothetical protein
MRGIRRGSSLVFLVLGACAASQQTPRPAPAPNVAPSVETVRKLVDSLDLAHYKATIKGLTQFGDRRQGTERNRRANDWIAAQLASYGCANVERLAYEYHSTQRPAVSASRQTESPPRAAGGGRSRGIVAPTSVNEDPKRQPDLKLRELDSEPTVEGPREEVYCTKVGVSRPDEMYIVGAHMDGHGYGEAANDDASGTALVLELARILNRPGVRTQRSIRFILWNNEETGLDGSRAYVAQRASLQGREIPPRCGHYPEPKWLGMIQHDMMLFDHGMPRDGGIPSAEQRPEADVNIEFQVDSKLADDSQKLAWVFARANERYASTYPASVGNHMTNTDSTPFMNLTPSISLRENERGTQIGSGWDPHWHQATDVFTTFSDADFALGLNAAETSLGAIAELAGVTVD